MDLPNKYRVSSISLTVEYIYEKRFVRPFLLVHESGPRWDCLRNNAVWEFLTIVGHSSTLTEWTKQCAPPHPWMTHGMTGIVTVSSTDTLTVGCRQGVAMLGLKDKI